MSSDEGNMARIDVAVKAVHEGYSLGHYDEFVDEETYLMIEMLLREIALQKLTIEDFAEMADDDTNANVDALDMERRQLRWCLECMEQCAADNVHCDVCGANETDDGYGE